MALIPILPEDIKVSSVKVHPNQHFLSSSNSGITGDVFLFAERSSTLKEITAELEEYTFDVKSLLSLDDSGNIVRKDTRKNRNDISGIVNNYIDSIGQLAGSLDNDKKLIVYRFDMPHRFNANTIRKSIFTKNLLPFYQGEYERPLSFGFSNYHSLNFFTSSAAFPSDVPSDSALVYPVPTTSSLDPAGVTRYKPSRYFPSSSFSFEFYINPRYTTDTSNDPYRPGTILNMPNCYTISIHSGSHVDELGRPKSFRLALQLGDYTTRPLDMIKLPGGSGASGSLDERTFISADSFIEKDRWSYCAIRWGGPKQENCTGSFYINGKNAGSFVIPETSLSFGRENFTNLNDIPSALFVGNRYRCSNSTLIDGTAAVDDDDRIRVLTGSIFSPAVPAVQATGKMTVTVTNTDTNSPTTRQIFFVTSSVADISLPADTVRLNTSAADIYASATKTQLRDRLVGALGGSSVDTTSITGTAASAIIDFTKEIPAGDTIVLTDSSNNSVTYTSSDAANPAPPSFKSGNTASSDASAAAISALSLAQAILHSGGHNGTIKASANSGRLVLNQSTKGTAGNKNITNTIDSSANATVPAAFTGGTSTSNPEIPGTFNVTPNGDIITLSTSYNSRIDIIPSSSIRISPAQEASGSQGNFLSKIFSIESQVPVYGNSNSTASKTSFLFDSGSANTFGVENLLGDINTEEGTSHTLDFPLNAELQEVRIFSRYRNNSEIKSTAEKGYYDFGDKDFLFYLPPYFIPSSSVRQMMSTVTQTHYSSSHTPFNTDLSFGQGGKLINLENFSYDLVTGKQALCYNLSATAPTGTWSDFSADDFDFMPATEALLLKPQNRKRNLTILPSDLGSLKPGMSFLDSRVSTLTNGISREFFVNDRKEESVGMINMRNVISLDAQYNDLSSFDEESGNVDSIVNRLFPKIEVARAGSGQEAGQYKEISHSEAYGQQSKIGLTVLNRTRDPDSNEIMFLDISNIFYGDAIKQESFEMYDPYVTGSAGKIKLTFRDNGTGNLYRCDASGSHPTWSQAGILLYEEGLACLTNPTIPPFGMEQFGVKFKGDRNLHVLEMRVPISADEARISTNPTFQKLAPTDLPADREIGCNLITNMFLHDENLNVIGKVNLSRPIVRKDEDRYVFKFKMDF